MGSPNLGYDDNPGGTHLFIVQIVFLVFAWIVCILRAYVKLFMIKKVTAEDWFMLASLLVYTASGAIIMHGCEEGGVGKLDKDLTLEETIIGMRSWYLGEVLYAPIALFARTSISLFLLRLSGNAWHKVASWGVIIVSWVVSIAYFFLMVFQCNPPSYFWVRFMNPLADGQCLDEDIVPIATIAMCGICGVLDWVIGLLPIALLWNVKINRRTKLGIAGLLSMGMFAGAALFVRIPFLIPLLSLDANFLANTITIAILTALEPALGILAGSIATLRPLFKTIGFGISSTKKQSAYPENNNNTGGSRGWPSSRASKGIIKLQDMSPTTPGQETEAYFVDSQAQHQHIQPVSRPSTNHSVKVSQTKTWDVEMAKAHSDWESAAMGNSSTITSDWDGRPIPVRGTTQQYQQYHAR